MAKPHQYIDQYRKDAVNSASPLQLIVMLYDGALKFMAAGKRAIIAQDVFEQNKNLQKAQKIVAELISCLDMKKGGEIAENLMALYTFCYNKLVEANVQDDPDAIDQVSEVLTNLRAGWVELERNTRTTTHHAEAA